MRTIIAGSRSCTNMLYLLNAIAKCGWRPTTVLCGMASGADTLGKEWALSHGVFVEEFPADWQKFGKRAGFVRNAEMANHAEALIALWDGASRGTGNMIDIARKKNLKVYVELV